jgi:hypothetical protein
VAMGVALGVALGLGEVEAIGRRLEYAGLAYMRRNRAHHVALIR